MNRKPEKIECIYTVKRFGKPYRWIARPTIEKEKKYLGCFDSHDKAVEALERFYRKQAQYDADSIRTVCRAPLPSYS